MEQQHTMEPGTPARAAAQLAPGRASLKRQRRGVTQENALPEELLLASGPTNDNTPPSSSTPPKQPLQGVAPCFPSTPPLTHKRRLTSGGAASGARISPRSLLGANCYHTTTTAETTTTTPIGPPPPPQQQPAAMPLPRLNTTTSTTTSTSSSCSNSGEGCASSNGHAPHHHLHSTNHTSISSSSSSKQPQCQQPNDTFLAFGDKDARMLTTSRMPDTPRRGDARPCNPFFDGKPLMVSQSCMHAYDPCTDSSTRTTVTTQSVLHDRIVGNSTPVCPPVSPAPFAAVSALDTGFLGQLCVLAPRPNLALAC